MLKQPEKFTHGFCLHQFSLSPDLLEWVKHEKWAVVDQYFLSLTAPEGELFCYLQNFHSFNKIETMLSIRNSENEWEEDGIWHDDGSRVFAFSLSLTINAELIEGGNLELRQKNSESAQKIPTPEFGTAILFLTGIHGFEHRTRRVLKGKRVMLVGWCSI